MNAAQVAAAIADLDDETFIRLSLADPEMRAALARLAAALSAPAPIRGREAI